ncbi:CobW family GTP-binding protein [Alicycliphilus denitrificans]|uniref:CobW family GTP-binding protein n=1 Tax=Alicycliphilus denitrificans TaxID=179636 RepID=UPI003850EDFF
MLKPQHPIALTVLGGFLGAGKTTLLNHLLRTQHRERVLVMVNDFGAINIDAQLIAQSTPDLPDGIINLANGCACCAIGGDLMQAFLKVLSLPELPDRVVVEASGVGDPARIAAMGRSGGRFRGDGVITVVDAQAVRSLAQDRYVGETVQAQLRAADLLLVNKTDLVTPEDLAGLHAWLGAQAPGVPVLESRQAEVDPRLILGPAIGAAPEEDGDAPAPAGPVIDHAARFVSHTFATPYPLQRQALEGALNALPAHVLRAKGMVFLEGEDAPRVLQLCGRRWSIGNPGTPQNNRRSRIVLIAARRPDVAPFNAWSHFGEALAAAS